jgi:hypothetical protein
MAVTLASLAADVAAAEANEANIGTVVTVTLPSGGLTATGTLRGRTDSFGMELAGFSEKRRDEVMIRAALLTAHGFTKAAVIAWAKTSAFTIDSQSWNIESVDAPDSAVYIFKLVQNW